MKYFISAKLDEGVNNVTMIYIPQGMIAGLLLQIVAIAFVCTGQIREKHFAERNNG